MGKSKMTAKGAWDNTGSVTISAGTLMIDGGSLGTGALTVARNASLSGVGTLANSNITINGIIQPGKSAAALNATIDCGAKNLTVSTTGTYTVTVRRCATRTNDGCANITNIGKLTLSGTINVELSPFQNLTTGDSIRIFTCKTFTGNPKFNLPRQFVWDTSRIREGLLFITGMRIMEDVNDDGIVDTQDVLCIYQFIQDGSLPVEGDTEACDVNGDGIVDTQDVLKIYEYMQKE